MGRCIYSDGEFVWKYVFAAQNSEQYRINEELGLGEYEPECFHSISDDYTEEEILEGKEEGWITEDGFVSANMDQLTLSIEDVPKLKSFLEKKNFEKLKADYKNIYVKYDANENDGIRFDSPLHNELMSFAETNDYYFLAMVNRFVNFMKKKNEEEGTLNFVFEGEF